MFSSFCIQSFRERVEERERERGERDGEIIEEGMQQQQPEGNLQRPGERHLERNKKEL